MRAFLTKKGVTLSPKVYFIDALSSMAIGLFATLIVGVILEKTIGGPLGIPFLEEMGRTAQGYMGPAIGAAVAYGLKAPPLVLFSALVVGGFGASYGDLDAGLTGGPAGAFVAALVATEIGKLVSKETRIDILVTPIVTVAVGYTVAYLASPSIGGFVGAFGEWIEWAITLRPVLMGIIVAVLMGLALTAPISSAAIAFMLELEGVAAGAATIGCSAQMIGFAVASFRENGWGGFFAQGIGTSMLQVPNIVRNPLVLIPPTIAGAVLAPIATTVWIMENNPAGAGMGTSGFVGQFMTFQVMGFSTTVLLQVVVLHIVAPAVLSLLLSEWLRKIGWIRPGDLRLDQGGN
ncbi:PTS transporter subunit IIC [Bacillus fonticola]|uniref:PTS transporter subunit IIC n=1 Tax=Bacillus fonticola TaxID=2728853 RepID=UPI0014743F59|nr:PTS sugar transporter subunit IIC [Bacillus fonticola]